MTRAIPKDVFRSHQKARHMFDQKRHVRRRNVLGVFATSMMAVMAACGTDSGPSQTPDLTSATAKSPTQTTTPSNLRAAYIASTQRDAPASYAARTIDGVARMNNRAQRFAASVNDRGLTIQPSKSGWHLSMHTTSVGCAGDMQPVEKAAPTAQGNRVELAHEGLTEWYVNGPLGVEQGFVLEQAPACAGPKVISMAVDGGLSVKLDDPDGDGQGDVVRFLDDDGKVQATYADLFVTDATGKVVAASLSAKAGEVSIVVDDVSVMYPLMIDPLVAVLQGQLLAADATANDQAGGSVSISGDRALVGVPNADGSNPSSGAAYVFVRSGTTWTQEAKLVVPEVNSGDRLGSAVALSGSTAVVGAGYLNEAGNSGQGAAFVFVHDGMTWNQQAKLVATNGSADDEFGKAVAISGDSVLVGASYSDTTGATTGSAYVFTRTGTTWTQQTELTASDGAALDFFGSSVSLSADTALIGAYEHDLAGQENAGAAYVFVRAGSSWTLQAKLTAPDSAAYHIFGSAVSVDGNTALVGAARAETLLGADQGAAYVFERSGTAWTMQTKLTGNGGGMVPDEFGSAVSLVGNQALVGAPNADAMGEAFVGEAVLFTRNGTSWTHTADLVPPNPELQAFGEAVSLSETGTTALVGAPAYSIPNIGFGSGSAYVFGVGDANGDACSTASECANGFCVDGVCCNSACGGGETTDCQACSIAAGAAANGTCAPTTAGTECRGSAGACDIAESCNGTDTACPADTKAPTTTSCRAASGVCDVADTCDGTSNDCPMDAVAQAGILCRLSVGDCDAPEICDGASGDCPMDEKSAAGILCRLSAGACDAPESCDGASNDCPANEKAAAGIACRLPADLCDAAEVCDGTSDECPADAKAAAGTFCRLQAGACDAAEVCDGTADACPDDKLAAAGTECRVSSSTCDAAEVCDGASIECPKDELAADGTTCGDRGTCSAGVCDGGEPPLSDPPVVGGGGCECSVSRGIPTSPWQAPLAFIAMGLAGLRRRFSKR